MNSSVQTVFKDVVSVKYALGYRGDFKNNLFMHQDMNRIIYPAGHNIIYYNSESRQQNITPCYNGTLAITAMAISPSRRYLAWSEEAEFGIIMVVDLINGKKKTLSSVEIGSKSYVSLSFSKEETKGLVSLSGPPEWNLVFWDWNKNKCLGFVKIAGNTKLYHCFYHPKEEDFVCVIGNNVFKIYKLTQDSTIKHRESPLSKKESKDLVHSPNYLSYCLLSNDQNSLVVGTDQGEILFFNNNCEFKMILISSPLDGFAIECIITCNKGFVAGGSNCTAYLFDKHEGDLKNPYHRAEKKIQHKDLKGKITSMLLTTGEEYLVMGLEDGSLLQVNFNIDRGLPDDSIKFDPVVQFFHTKKITGMDVSIRKTLFATCSLDKFVKVWNYSDHTLENNKEFDEEALALAFHPSGHHLVVAFTDKVRMLNIFEHDLLPYKEINIKGCKEISFSNGGHLFAVANTNIIQIFQFYTGENPANLVFRGHSLTVKSIFWHEDDLGFYSGGSDGNIFEYRLEDSAQKYQLFNVSSYNISCIAATSDKVVYAAGINSSVVLQEEKFIQEIKYQTKDTKERESSQEHTKKYTVFEPTKIFTGANISQLTLSNSNKLFFMGTDEKNLPGSLRITKYPFTQEILELQLHSRPISKLKVTFDDNYLFTAGEDGTLFICDIKDSKDKDLKIKRDNPIAFADEFLIPREKYNKKIKKLETMKLDIASINLKNDIKTQSQTKERDDRIKALEAEIKLKTDSEANRYEALLDTKKRMEKEYDEKKLLKKQQHEQNKKSIEAEYKQKIALEVSRLEELEKEKKREEDEFHDLMKTCEEKFEREILEKKTYYEMELKKESYFRNQIFKENKENEEEFKRLRDELEDKAEVEIEQTKEKNEVELKRLNEARDEQEIEKRSKKTQLEADTQKQEEQRTKLKEILEEIQRIQEANKAYNKEKESREKEIEEREKTIKDKTRRIFELKKKTQELEKFKFVLDYKIKELKRDIGPKEEEIAKMKEQISNMNAEILHFKRTNANLSLIVTDLNLRQKGMKKEIEELKKVRTENNKYIHSFESDVSECFASIMNFKALKKEMLKLYNKYVQNDSKKFEANVDIQTEFISQRGHLETNIKSLKDKFEKNMEAHQNDNKRIMKENVDLIKEINDLKRELKNLKDEGEKKKKNPGESLIKNKTQGFKQAKNDLEFLEAENQEIINNMQRQYEQLLALNKEMKERRPVSGVKLPSLSSKSKQEEKVDISERKGSADSNRIEVIRGITSSKEIIKDDGSSVKRKSEEELKEKEDESHLGLQIEDKEEEKGHSDIEKSGEDLFD